MRVLYRVQLLMGDYGITPGPGYKKLSGEPFCASAAARKSPEGSQRGNQQRCWHSVHMAHFLSSPNETFDKLVISFARFLSHHLLLYHAAEQENAAVFMHFALLWFLLHAGNMSRSQIAANKRYYRTLVPDSLNARFPSILPCILLRVLT